MPVPTALDERHVAGLIGRHQAGDAERGVRTERQRIEEVVIDAAVDHVDALRPLGRPHVDDAGLDEQVAALDQLDAELVGQERMLVIGRVVHAGGEQHDGRIARRRIRRERFQRGEQFVGIVLHRRDAVAREQLREQPHHDLAVLQHVGDPGRRAGVVLEHIEACRHRPERCRCRRCARRCRAAPSGRSSPGRNTGFWNTRSSGTMPACRISRRP